LSTPGAPLLETPPRIVERAVARDLRQERKCRPIPDARKLRQFGATGWWSQTESNRQPLQCHVGNVMQGLLRWFEQFWQPHAVVGDEAKGEDRLNLGKAAHFQLRQAADGFAPAEDFLDPFATNHADRITLAGRDVRRHSRLANLAQLAHPAIDGDVRLDL